MTRTAREDGAGTRRLAWVVTAAVRVIPASPPQRFSEAPETAGADPAAGELDGHAAQRTATALERAGWRAEPVPLAQGLAKVEVRALGVRGMPLVATLRTGADVDAFRRAFPGRRAPGPLRAAADWARTAVATGLSAAQLESAETAESTPAPAPADVRALRYAAGLRQRDLAARLGVARSTLADAERGRRTGPDAQAVLRRAVALLNQTRLDPDAGPPTSPHAQSTPQGDDA